ncbi:MAG: F0F1 ATP synthase subunit gamma [Gammaproteobacteria bacterium]
MTDTLASLRRKIDSAADLHAVVRTMKALAGSSIGQYEKSVRALADYDRAVALGLKVSLSQIEAAAFTEPEQAAGQSSTGAVVFGSDQGLVGQFNDVIADYAIEKLASLPGTAHVWAVGERVRARLLDADLAVMDVFAVPASVAAITTLVGQILLRTESLRARDRAAGLQLFYNRPTEGAIYTPVDRRLLPLDAHWRGERMKLPWPARSPPEVIGVATQTLEALIGEYLFVSLFRACAESLASENASRLAAMQRAEKNIDELLEGMNAAFHRLRQSSIDEELFDVVSGFEALRSR